MEWRLLFWGKNSLPETTLPETNILLMAEILHQLIGSLSHYLQGFIHPGARFLPSTVAPENGWLEYDPFGSLPIFQGLLL